eukprot:CAMPEP_0168568238 /NCGR_PEP_ID=MMETSP0413-20121227/15460_1 /TAXON_ID=136452 /ORGANISM="Filamoeba nolandi, Strain NC-AS-23-1" /LENGTH=354 /DNA_ID=CAMNT_0008600539 /DNA_START=51 /DNA_END=1112 /DNA_ORIENTATION=+
MNIFKLFLLVTLFWSVLGDDENQWTTKDSMPTPRSDFTATTISKEILVVGGCDVDQICPDDSPVCYCPHITAKVEAYKPIQDEWEVLPDMPRERYRHAAATVNGKLYLFGGRDLSDVIIQQIDIYDTSSKTWSTVSSNWTSATSDLVAVPVDSSIYVIGGYDQNYATLGNIQIFDTTQLSWKSVSLASMNISRGDACAAFFDGGIIVVGGFNEANFCQPLTSVEFYNITTNTWQSRTPLFTGVGDCACAIGHGTFHVIGGESKDDPVACSKFSVPIANVSSLAPGANSKWQRETQFPDVRFRFAGAAFGRDFFVFGGQAELVNETLSYPVLGTVEAYEDLSSASAVRLSFGMIL